MFLRFRHKKKQISVAPAPLQNVTTMPCFWPYRLVGNSLLLLIIASVSMIIITFRDNLINKKIDSILEQFYTASVQYGWGIDDILIQGRQKTTREEIIEKLNLKRSDNILKLNLHEIKNKIEELPWVKTATVKRTFYPNTLQISIIEKTIIALWQSEDKFYPVDQSGNLIEAEFTPRQPILIIVGENAPQKIKALLDVLSISPEILARMKAAKLYAGRRWDIILDDLENGLTIKMPEKHMERTWKKFLKINNQHGLLKRKLTFIDLRYENKLTVTLDDSTYVNSKNH